MPQKKRRFLEPETFEAPPGATSDDNWKVEVAETRERILKNLGWQQKGKSWEPIEGREQLINRRGIQLAMSQFDSIFNKHTFLTKFDDRDIEEAIIPKITNLIRLYSMDTKKYGIGSISELNSVIEAFDSLFTAGVHMADSGFMTEKLGEERRVVEREQTVTQKKESQGILSGMWGGSQGGERQRR